MKSFIYIYVIFTINLASVKAQTADSVVFREFDNAIFEFLENKEKIKDFALVYHTQDFYVSLNKEYHYTGIYYNFSYDLNYKTQKRDICKPSYSDFKEFINLMIPQTDKKCRITEFEGNIIFLSCPMELWQQFYLDVELYKDDACITPFLDIFCSTTEKVFHKRIILQLKYSQRKKQFRVINMMVIRETFTKR